jgi:hypothetical protein
MCIGVSPNDRVTATVTHCGRAGSWIYDPTAKRLRHSGANGKCLAVVRSEVDSTPRAQLTKCDANDLGKIIAKRKNLQLGSKLVPFRSLFGLQNLNRIYRSF